MNTSLPTILPAFTRVAPAKSLGALVCLLAWMLLAPQLRADLPPITLFSFPSDFFPSGSLLQARDGCLYGTTQNGGTNRHGMVFRMGVDGSISTIYSFTGGNDGGQPYAGLIQARNGVLYGTTTTNGLYQFGTVFRLTTNGVFTTLYSFTGASDGGNPYAGLIQASDGSLYGTTARGGTYGAGTVFRITSLGGFSTVHTFNGDDGAFPFGSLVQGADGYLYGTTLRGGAGNGSQYEFGTVFRLSLQGAFTSLHSFNGGDGAYPAAALIRAKDGNLYGTAAAAASDGSTPLSNGTIFRVTPSGIVSMVYTFTGNTDGANPYGPLFQASDGYLYGTTASGANTNGGIYRLATDGTFTALAPFSGPDGSQPYGGLMQGLDGNLYGTTTQGGTDDGGTVFRYIIAAPPFVLVQPVSQAATNRTAVSFSVLAGGSAPLGYQWLRNGASLTDGAVRSGTTTGTLTLSDVAATDAGIYTLLLTNAYGRALSSNATLSVTVIKPTLTLLSPAPNARCSNSVLTVTGKASGLLGVDAVYYQLNNSGWNLAQTTNGWAKWTADLAGLSQGTNTFQAYAVDSGGRASVTNTLKVFYVVSAPLTIQITGRGRVTPNYTGKLLEQGRSYTLQAIPARGFLFTNWTGSVTSRAPKLTFLMGSNLSFSANFVDVTRPVTVLLSPKANQRLTNALVTLNGRATDNDAVASIFYQLNNSEWALAQTTNNWTNWTAQLTLSPGTNQIRAYAVDATRLVSLTNNPKYFYVVPAPVDVQIAGRGTVTPNYTGKLLELGRSYTLVATPAPGFVFSNWSGSVSLKSTKLAFLMQSNLTFTANFADVARPLVTLLAPKANQRTTNALFTVSGRATDNGGVGSVWYQLNNAGWNEAQSTNRWASWTAMVPLSVGTNSLQVYALDSAGNSSVTNRVNVIRLP